MRNLARFAATGMLLGLLWTPGIGRAASASRSAAARSPNAPKLTDAQLEAAIRAKFAASKINADKFTVHVQGGVATIEGKADVMQHKGVATRMAKTAGASAVNNHVQISEAAREKAAANLATGRRRAQISRGQTRSTPRSETVRAAGAPRAAPPVRSKKPDEAHGTNP